MKRIQKIEEHKKVKEEILRINTEIDNTLTKIIKEEGSLSNYELWINEKFKDLISTNYIITIKNKDLKKEGYSTETVYLIIKND